ncbi:MAG: hypothetical protein LBP50_10930 [Tannerella sp.]|jgi:hypothetical protein|nr:hypothetical protein [Tannerella sp.]
MNTLNEIILNLFNLIFGQNTFFASLFEAELLIPSGVSLALGVAAHAGITEGVRQNTRRWHGGIDDRFAAINNLVGLITAHQPAWTIPADLLDLLTGNRDRLQTMINHCRTSQASTADRERRNTLLKNTVALCVTRGKIWAYTQYAAGILTVDDVHHLGFLLPGETGGHHARKEATDAVAEVKVKIINEDFIHVVIDRSAGENAAQVAHGWPTGVKQALIVITAADGKTEIIRQMTVNLHNDIRMPEGSHGKQFIIKAAFLRHVNDEPRFGNEPTFSMPLTTADLAATLNRQHHEEFEAQVREVERQRREIERLNAIINASKS